MENNKKICKNKKCMKPLPDGYKHKYCESCRNRYIQRGKNILKGIGSAACTVVVTAIGAALCKEKKPKK